MGEGGDALQDDDAGGGPSFHCPPASLLPRAPSGFPRIRSLNGLLANRRAKRHTLALRPTVFLLQQPGPGRPEPNANGPHREPPQPFVAPRPNAGSTP